MGRRQRACSSVKRSVVTSSATFGFCVVVMMLSASITYNALAARSGQHTIKIASWLPTLPTLVSAIASSTTIETLEPTVAVAQRKKSAATRPKIYTVPAGRSPIPRQGEVITELIPARRLVTRPEKPLPKPDGPVRWIHADRYVGQKITVSGQVVETRRTKSVCFLNFSDDFQRSFYIVIHKKALNMWPEPPETYFLNKVVRIEGKVSIYQGRAQIRVHDPSQVLVVR